MVSSNFFCDIHLSHGLHLPALSLSLTHTPSCVAAIFMTSLSSPSETLSSLPRLTLPLCCLIIAALPLTPSTYSLFWHCHWPDRTALPSIAAWQPCSCLPDSAHSCPQCSASKTERPPNLPTTLRRLITATYTKHTQTHIRRLIPTLHRVDWWAAICTNPLFQHISNKSHFSFSIFFF